MQTAHETRGLTGDWVHFLIVLSLKIMYSLFSFPCLDLQASMYVCTKPHMGRWPERSAASKADRNWSPLVGSFVRCRKKGHDLVN